MRGTLQTHTLVFIKAGKRPIQDPSSSPSECHDITVRSNEGDAAHTGILERQTNPSV